MSSSVQLALSMQTKLVLGCILEEPLSKLVDKPNRLREFMDSIEVVLLGNSIICHDVEHLQLLQTWKKNVPVLVEKVIISRQATKEYEDKAKPLEEVLSEVKQNQTSRDRTNRRTEAIRKRGERS